jgi:hypothetical protein
MYHLGQTRFLAYFPSASSHPLGDLRHSLKAVPSSFYIYDLIEQRTLCTSCPISVMLGYDADAIHAMDATTLGNLIHSDDLKQVARHYQRFPTLSYGEIIAAEYRMKRADGSWCRLHSQETPLVMTNDGFPRQLLGQIQDMTRLAPPQACTIASG